MTSTDGTITHGQTALEGVPGARPRQQQSYLSQRCFGLCHLFGSGKGYAPKYVVCDMGYLLILSDGKPEVPPGALRIPAQ